MEHFTLSASVWLLMSNTPKSDTLRSNAPGTQIKQALANSLIIAPERS